MADFNPKFVDMVRNYTTTAGTADFVLSSAVNGFAGFAGALQAGDRFYYSCIGVDKPAEREIGRGTLTADGKIAREPVSGSKTVFTSGTKTVALVAAAEHFEQTRARLSSVEQSSSGALQSVASRAELAARAPGGSAMLRETAREGLFSWDGADLSSLVAADPEQGLYVASDTDPTGASGAWVRRFDGHANALWWIGNDPGAPGTGDKLVAALAALNAIRDGSSSDYKPVVPLYCPSSRGQYAMGSTTISPTYPIYLYGDHPGGSDYGNGTVLMWSGDVPAIVLAGYNGSSQQATGSVVRNLYLRGPDALSTGPGNNSDAIYTTSDSVLRDLNIIQFSGAGVHGYGNFSASMGNLNGAKFDNIRVLGCRWGVNIHGPDSNGVTLSHIYSYANYLGGILENSFLGNYINGGLTEACGPSATLPSRCTYSGNVYCVAFGQEAWCSTNPPSGTTANNQGWLYLEAGSASPTQPAWATGLTWYFGASLAMPGGSQRGVCIGMYFEPGMNPVIMDGSNLFVPAQSSSVPVRRGNGSPAAYINASSGAISANGNFAAQQISTTGTGIASIPAISTAGGISINRDAVAGAEPDIVLNAYNLTSWLRAYYGGSKFNFEARDSGLGYMGFQFYGDSWTFNYRFTSDIAQIDGGGLSLLSGTYKVGPTTVIDASRNGSFAALSATATLGYAAGAGGAVTQMTSRTTGVTLDKAAGAITLFSATTTAGQVTTFTVTNSTVAASDTVNLSVKSGSGTYLALVTQVAAGSFNVSVHTPAAVTTAEAPVINFAVVKAVAA